MNHRRYDTREIAFVRPGGDGTARELVQWPLYDTTIYRREKPRSSMEFYRIPVGQHDDDLGCIKTFEHTNLYSSLGFLPRGNQFYAFGVCLAPDHRGVPEIAYPDLHEAVDQIREAGVVELSIGYKIYLTTPAMCVMSNLFLRPEEEPPPSESDAPHATKLCVRAEHDPRRPFVLSDYFDLTVPMQDGARWPLTISDESGCRVRVNFYRSDPEVSMDVGIRCFLVGLYARSFT